MWAAAVFVLLSACASLPPPPPRAVSHAWANPQDTRLGRIVEASARDRLHSGFRLLVSGEDAFGSLATLADNAQHTLDLQYYIVEGDASGRALLERVRAAADRGVRVRLLIDDLNTSGEDARMLRMTRHRNIEVRLYNPFPAGRFSTVSRIVASINDFKRINHRMHMKMFVADNALAVTGGRNLGDAYFLHSPTSNFVDLDVIVGGRAVRRLSATFDRFWNDPLAYPIDAVASVPPDGAPSRPAGRRTQGEPPAPAPLDVATVLKSNRLAGEIRAGRLELTWAHASVIADKPVRLDDDSEGTQPVADQVAALMNSVKRELIIISPYFVPGREGIGLFSSLTTRGVKLRILTNSLATTDAPAVHIGYSRYRPELLDMGTELYELRPRLGQTTARLGSFGSSQASLHAKALVLDRQVAVIGSMNMDPRSARLNTEIGLVIHSPEIANQLVQLFEDVSRKGSYHVEFDADHRLQWTSAAPDPGDPGALPPQDAQDPQIPPDPAGPIVLHDEPEASAWRRFTLMLLRPFAPEEML